MKSCFIVACLLTFSLFGYSQANDTIYLWPHKVPGENQAKHPPVRTSNTEGNVIRLTDVTNSALLVFTPEKGVNNGCGVVVCPGGGYHILAADLEGSEIAKWLNKLGFTAFVLQYRVPNKRVGALNDIQRAIRVVRSQAKVWGIDPHKLGVMGFSAGASLCARASTCYKQDTYDAVDKADTISSRPDYSLLIYPAYLDKGENRSLTPELIVDKDTPAMFLFATADDPYGNSSLVMAKALRDAKVDVELHFLPKGGHGYGLRKGNVAAETWPGLAQKWINNMIR